MIKREKEIERILKARELDLQMERLQTIEQERNAIPADPDMAIRKHQNKLVLTGGVLLGFIAGVMTLVLNFVVFVLLLHIEF